MITVCPLVGGAGGPALGPTGFPLLVSLLPPTATANEISVANAIDAFVAGGGTLPLAFLNLFGLTPSQLANALNQLSGEAGTGAQESGFQLMNSFLSLLTNPFAENRGLAPDNPPPNPLVYYKAPFYKAPPGAARDPRRWNVWGAAYGGETSIAGDPAVGSNSLTARAAGFAAGIDYRVTPDTVVGLALAGGGTSWGLAAGLGGGRSDVFQAGLYGLQQFGAAYLSGALAYGSYWASTSRTVTFAGTDTLSASYNAQNFGGRLEGGYRLTFWAPFSVIPYAAVQAQSFRTPNYSESGSLGAADPFALSYAAQTGTVLRSELGSRFDQVFALPNRDSLVVFGPRRLGGMHWQSNPDLTRVIHRAADPRPSWSTAPLRHRTSRCSRRAPNGAGPTAGRSWPGKLDGAAGARLPGSLCRHRRGSGYFRGGDRRFPGRATARRALVESDCRLSRMPARRVDRRDARPDHARRPGRAGGHHAAAPVVRDHNQSRADSVRLIAPTMFAPFKLTTGDRRSPHDAAAHDFIDVVFHMCSFEHRAAPDPSKICTT